MYNKDFSFFWLLSRKDDDLFTIFDYRITNLEHVYMVVYLGSMFDKSQTITNFPGLNVVD